MTTTSSLRYVSLRDLGLANAPELAERWLSEQELAYWNRLSDSGRRATWLAGRVVAKQCVLQQFCRRGETADGGMGAAWIQIHSLDAWGRKSRPQVVWRGQVLPWSLSFAHTSQGVLLALETNPGRRVGVDLAAPGMLSVHFSQVWLTADERRLAARLGRYGLATWWALKEAYYKAANQGEAFAPRRVILHSTCPSGRICQIGDRMVRGDREEIFWIDGQLGVRVTVAAGESTAVSQTRLARNELRHTAHDHFHRNSSHQFGETRLCT